MNENESLKSTEPAPTVPDGYVSVQTVLEALYSAILRREITEQELERRLESIKNLDKNQLTQLVRSFMLSPEFADKFELLAAEQPLLQRNSIRHLSSKLRSVAVVAVFNEVWLPFCLAIADYLAEEYSLQTLLVTYSPFQRAYDAELLSPAVVSCVHIQDLFKLADSFEPDLMVVHSFGFKAETAQLLERFRYTPLFVCGDAYKNTVSDHFDNERPVAQSLMFGFNDGSTSRNKLRAVSSKVIPSEAVLRYRAMLADYFPFEQADVSKEPAHYAVFYLRYWGSGAYDALSDEEIVHCWVETVRTRLEPGTTLIIKNDPRVKRGMYQLFLQTLRDNQIATLDFTDYLHSVGLADEKMGMLPVEYFYTKGFLCRAVSHFVLDSSLAYSLAVEKKMRRPFKIYVGPDLAAFSQFNCQTAISNIKFGVELYSAGLLQSAETGRIRELGVPAQWPRCFELEEDLR